MTLPNLPRILKSLNDAGVKYVVIGGIAAIAHGSAYVTWDVDICYDPTPDNRKRLVALLLQWKAYLRGVEPGLPWVLDERTLRDSPVLTLDTTMDKVNVMDRVAGVGDFAAVQTASEPTSVVGVPTRVLSLDALIAAKRAAGRHKDLLALVELEALREIIRKREVRERGTKYRERRRKRAGKK